MRKAPHLEDVLAERRRWGQEQQREAQSIHCSTLMCGVIANSILRDKTPLGKFHGLTVLMDTSLQGYGYRFE